MGRFRNFCWKLAPCCFDLDYPQDDGFEMRAVNFSTSRPNEPRNDPPPNTSLAPTATRPQVTTSAGPPLPRETDKNDPITPVSKSISLGSSSRPVSDPDEITPAPLQQSTRVIQYATRDSMYMNVSHALVDRQNLFRKLRTPYEDPTENVIAAPMHELEAAREKARRSTSDGR